MKNADLSQSSTNLWGRTVMDYIKYYSNLNKTEKEQLIAQLNHDRVSWQNEGFKLSSNLTIWLTFVRKQINGRLFLGTWWGAADGRKGKQCKKNEKPIGSKSETRQCPGWLSSERAPGNSSRKVKQRNLTLNRQLWYFFCSKLELGVNFIAKCVWRAQQPV